MYNYMGSPAVTAQNITVIHHHSFIINHHISVGCCGILTIPTQAEKLWNGRRREPSLHVETHGYGRITTRPMNVSQSLIIGGETLENGEDKTEPCEINKEEHSNRQHQRVWIIMKDWRIPWRNRCWFWDQYLDHFHVKAGWTDQMLMF